MKITIIGLGLIGGSLALEFRKQHTVFGIDANVEHQNSALKLGLVEKIIPLDEIVNSDVVIIAIPVDVTPQVTWKVLDLINDETLVFDVGSTKEVVCNALKNHPKRKNFIAMHPIAGTEYSGPKAAIENLFINKVNIICEQNLSDKKQLKKLINLLEPLQMKIVYMDSSKQHDKHIAYVSHLSHISSFMLGKTVLEIEKGEKTIFNMAGSGFESTVRLAKSSPKTWTPIFIQNKQHILKSLDEYIVNLQTFRSHLEKSSEKEIFNSMQETNHIKEVLKGIK
ncbi:MAG: prephenate dehydrogenase [Flavobacteriaceae bacterium]